MGCWSSLSMSPTAWDLRARPPAAGRSPCPGRSSGPDSADRGAVASGRSCCRGSCNREPCPPCPTTTIHCCAQWKRSFPCHRSGTRRSRTWRGSGRTCSAPPRRLHPLDELGRERIPDEWREEPARRRETDFPAEAARVAQGERDPRRVDELRIADVDDIGQRNALLVRAEAHP